MFELPCKVKLVMGSASPGIGSTSTIGGGDDCWQGCRVKDTGDGGPGPMGKLGIGDLGYIGVDIDEWEVLVWLSVDMIGCGWRGSTSERRRVVGGGLLGLFGPVRAATLELAADMLDKLLEVEADKKCRWRYAQITLRE